ncbi:MAG: NADH-quinone oxidoreductase subunit D [Rikenellaceae bacterium]|jgi:NADH-quinone oxidoreductase subunit C/D|nr:NADH-quinone oxidoreductase subunit D [Rikenellaceae bacterium]
METLSNKLSVFEGVEVAGTPARIEVLAPADVLPKVASYLFRHEDYDYLIDVVGLDVDGRLGAIYYLSRSADPAGVVALKTFAPDRENPQLHTLSVLWASAELYEREVYDFFGIRFLNHPDMRRLFLRADWNDFPLRKDYDASPELNPVPLENEKLSDMETIPTLELHMGRTEEHTRMVFDKDEYVVNFGPQHPAMHGVLHLRVSLDGEIIRKIDPVFGYIHRGVEKMCEAYTYPQILHLTDRLDYLSGTINRHAVCLLAEKALEIEVSQRAVVVRTIMDELTRIASHLLGWGCMCMDMGSITAFVYGMRDREKIMDIFEQTAGGRLMANYNIIGGVANDIHPEFQKKIKEFIPYMRKMLKEHHMLFTGNPIARGRMKDIGYLDRATAISLGATGPVGRASGWHNDIRKIEPYAAYGSVKFEEVIRTGCETFDRYIIRLDEIEQSLRILEQLVDNIPEGDFAAKTKAVIRLPEGEYFQRVENARGQFCVHVTSTGDKYPYRIKFRSPSQTLVTALKTVATGTKVADLIMLGASMDYVIPCIDR